MHITFTRFISASALSKSFRLDKGEIIKTPAAQMTTGKAERVSMSFEKFANALLAADAKTAFGCGIYDDSLPDTVKITVSGRENPPSNCIASTLQYFQYGC